MNVVDGGKIDAKVQELRELHEVFQQSLKVLDEARVAYERAIREAQDIRKNVRRVKYELDFLVLPVAESSFDFNYTWPEKLTDWELDKLNEEQEFKEIPA